MILASFKLRLVLPFWYWLTQVVLEKRPLHDVIFTTYLFYHLTAATAAC